MLRRLLHTVTTAPRRATTVADPKFLRDRGLDHAVERELHLKPALSLKNLIKSEPSKSLPLSLIVNNKDILGIPFRPIEFVRRYPALFQEFFPGNVRIEPHVRLTDEAVSIDRDEMLVYGSDGFRKSTADRVLRLLMLCKGYEVPVRLVDRLKWDLGLPDDYIETIVPEFNHYFRVKDRRDKDLEGLLEIVCWDKDLAVSIMEKKAMKSGSGYQKGMPIVFPMSFSKEFVMDKQMKREIEEWQKLPYVSPYDNVLSLKPRSEESDKWAVAVLHELLHIFVHKKSERENVLRVGEFLRIRSRFKRALVNHPGFFYLSNKNGTYTVVPRDAYKRESLIEKHPLMEIRNKYIHLMHTVKEVQNSMNEQSTSEKPKLNEAKGNVDAENNVIDEERHVSDSEEVDSDDDADEEEVNKVKTLEGSHMTISQRRGRGSDQMSAERRRRSLLITEKRGRELSLATEKHAKLGRRF
ncbi:hypothetical protein Drorol1_Dr00019456 [Drosera rotundifolia]